MSHIAKNGLRCLAAAKAVRSAPSSAVLAQTSFFSTRQSRRDISFEQVHYNLKAYNQYGLLQHDLLNETPVVQEALKRMPPAEYDERCFRICRAMQLTINQTVLPKDEWTPYELDKEKGEYLQPYIDMVKRENKEKEDWYKQ